MGKVQTIRNYNFEALKRTLNQIWTLSKEALFRRIENSLFVIQFATAKDKAKVMAGRPWTFDNHLVLLEEIDGSVQPSEISLTRCPFWLRLYNLPMDSRGETVVRAIGGGIGEVMEVESDGIAWDKSAQVKVNLDVSKPLRRIQQLKTRVGRLVVIEIKYERLPTFCYECGIIGHIETDCPIDGEEGHEEDKQWGVWLRASPRKGRMKMVEETKTFMNSSKRLVFVSKEPVGEVSQVEGGRAEELREMEGKVVEQGEVRNDVISLTGEKHLEHVPNSHAVSPSFLFVAPHINMSSGDSINALNVGLTSHKCGVIDVVGRGKDFDLNNNVVAANYGDKRGLVVGIDEGFFNEPQQVDVEGVGLYVDEGGGEILVETVGVSQEEGRGVFINKDAAADEWGDRLEVLEERLCHNNFDVEMVEGGLGRTKGGKKWRKLARNKPSQLSQVVGIGIQGTTGKRLREVEEGSDRGDQKNKKVIVDVSSIGWRVLTRFSLAKLNEFLESEL